MSLTLKEVTLEYKAWRNQSRRGRIPEHLREQALSLLETHSIKAVSEALGISAKSIQNWKKQAKPESVNFVPLVKPQGTIAPSSEQNSLTLVLPGEIKLLLNGLDSMQAVEFITGLSKELSR